MPLKVWAPNERLTSADLNAAFAWVNQAHMPFVQTGPGSATAVAAATNTEIPPGAVIHDSSGFLVGNRLVIPAGLGGLYLFAATATINGAATAGDWFRLLVSGMGIAAWATLCPRPQGAPGYGVFTAVANVSAGAAVFLQAYAAAAGNVTNNGMSLTRLATMGAY